MSKKELNAWDRFWLVIKQNEKLIWVGLLVIIAPSFAFPVSWMFGSGQGNPVVYNLFGEDVTRNDFLLAQRNLRAAAELRASSSSRFAARSPIDRHIEVHVLDFLLYKKEAERLGIRVSDEELGAVVRETYWTLKAQQAAQEAGQKAPAKDAYMAAQQAFFAAISQGTSEFGEPQQREWYDILSRLSISRLDFEEGLREILQAEKLEEYVNQSVHATPQEALEAFRNEEQTRKLSFFEVRSDEAKAEVEKSITDADLKAHYERNQESFREPLKIRFDYVSVPVAAFQDKVALTDEDLRKKYDEVKVAKYQTFVGGGVEGSFELLTPEERAEREKKAFRPFEEVKEEVRATVLTERSRALAKVTADQIRSRLYPDKPGAIAEKPAETPAPATVADITKEFPVVKSGTSPWFDRSGAEKTLPAELYAANTINVWFSQADPRDGSKKALEAPRSYLGTPAFGKEEFYVFYQNPQVRPAGVPKLADVQDKVREAVVKEKLLERGKEKAKAIVEAIREGKKTFEAAAQELGQQVVASGFVGHRDDIRVPLTPEEKEKAAAEAKDKPRPAGEDAAEPKDKEHPGSSAIVDYGFKALHEKGKVEGFAEDPANGVCYIVRWDDVIYPDTTQFEKKRQTYEDKARRDKLVVYRVEWAKQLHERANPLVMKSSGESSRSDAPVDPNAE